MKRVKNSITIQIYYYFVRLISLDPVNTCSIKQIMNIWRSTKLLIGFIEDIIIHILGYKEIQREKHHIINICILFLMLFIFNLHIIFELQNLLLDHLSISRIEVDIVLLLLFLLLRVISTSILRSNIVLVKERDVEYISFFYNWSNIQICFFSKV